MPKKKPKRKVPQPKVDLQKLQEDARRQHIEGSTALVLQHADRHQKELLGQWIEEATKIKKQEALQGLEREIGKHEGLVESTNSVLQTLKWGLQDDDEGLESGVHTLETTHSQLSSLQDKRRKNIFFYFQERSQEMRNKFFQSIQQIKNSHSEFIRQLQTLTQLIREEDAALAYEENFHQSSDLSLFQNRAVELQHQLQSRAAAAAQTLKGSIEKAAQSHAAATEGLVQEFKRLSAQDQTLAKQVQEKHQQIERLQLAIRRWKEKARQHKQDFEERNSRIKAEAEQLRKHCKELRNEIEAARALEKQRLIEVSLCAKEKKKALLEQLQLADKIHRMAALCRKYERPEVELPSVCTVSEEELKTWSKESQKLHASLKEAMETAGEETAALQNFMKKISKVTLEAACLERSLSLLSLQNKKQKFEIKTIKENATVEVGRSVAPPQSLLSVCTLRGPTKSHKHRKKSPFSAD